MLFWWICQFQTVAVDSSTESEGRSYIYAPEFLDGVECDDLLEQIIPIVALFPESHVSNA